MRDHAEEAQESPKPLRSSSYPHLRSSTSTDHAAAVPLLRFAVRFVPLCGSNRCTGPASSQRAMSVPSSYCAGGVEFDDELRTGLFDVEVGGESFEGIGPGWGGRS